MWQSADGGGHGCPRRATDLDGWRRCGGERRVNSRPSMGADSGTVSGRTAGGSRVGRRRLTGRRDNRRCSRRITAAPVSRATWFASGADDPNATLSSDNAREGVAGLRCGPGGGAMGAHGRSA
eukprot:939067_1